MAIVKEVFEKPLRQNAVLTEYECHEIFVNWDELHHCNDKLLRALRVRKTRSNHGIISTVGDIMCENFPNMTQYIRYCACQLRACEILHRKKEENSEFEAVHRICVTDARSKGMPLSSFLLKPTQRITRYPLLLKNILKNTPIGHPDRLYLEEALEKAEELCSQVNEGVRERENSDTLEWIQLHVNCDALPEKITFNSITNLLGQRKFLHYGSLSKSKSGKELMGFLFNDFFLLATPTKPNTCKNLNIKRQPHVYLQLYRDPLILNEILIEKAGPEFSEDSSHFILKTLNTVVGLKASTPGDKQAWVKRIRAAAASYASTEKSLLQRQASAEDPPKGRVLVGVIGAFDLAQGKSVRPRPSKGVLRVLVASAEDLVLNITGKCDPFCEVTMGSQVHRTKVVNGAVNPKWNHSMQFVVKDLKQDVLCITIYDKDLFSPDEFLGRTEMRVSEIMEETGCTRGPVLKRLPLYEVQHGTVEVKFDLQLFQGDGNQRSDILVCSSDGYMRGEKDRVRRQAADVTKKEGLVSALLGFESYGAHQEYERFLSSGVESHGWLAKDREGRDAFENIPQMSLLQGFVLVPITVPVSRGSSSNSGVRTRGVVTRRVPVVVKVVGLDAVGLEVSGRRGAFVGRLHVGRGVFSKGRHGFVGLEGSWRRGFGDVPVTVLVTVLVTSWRRFEGLVGECWFCYGGGFVGFVGDWHRGVKGGFEGHWGGFVGLVGECGVSRVPCCCCWVGGGGIVRRGGEGGWESGGVRSVGWEYGWPGFG
ncbi:unnamed protein product [Notodromas monacha]|uniref:Uncharacterized protein n=1 Tax=Notodromas monacha TaxID=399045 RepID=A0A7R9BNW1_9CRUS|nr:unnamed protein product [Notodromas monacha]CAG0918974.1 unnamed protein product [Notodromas monacha]